jgi:Mn2+/Fe2+ NRAMP family transporter
VLKRTRGGVLRKGWARLKQHPLARVGPGLITGVADDDPSGIATYSQAGAQFGLNMLWTMPLVFPLMSAIQYICASIGRVTGKGLAANIKDAFPLPIIKSVVLLLLVANTLNIAADVAAMGEVAELITGYNRHLMTAVFVIATLLLQIFIPYHRYVRFLKWLTLSLLAYAAVLFTVHVPWGQVMLRTVWPDFTPNAAAAAVVVGVFGTTISPYLFFWQASEEVEDMHAGKGSPLLQDSHSAEAELRRIRWDTWSGMFYSDLTGYFIILATAVTLNVAGITDINTAAQAASALRPLAGEFAYTLFALWDSRCRPDRRAGACCLGRVRAGRNHGLEHRARARGEQRPRVLQHHLRECARGSRDSIPAHQPHEGALLERGHQRGGGSPSDGGDHPAGVEEIGNGCLRREPADRHPRLDRDSCHGRCSSANVHARLRARDQWQTTDRPLRRLQASKKVPAMQHATVRYRTEARAGLSYDGRCSAIFSLQIVRSF